MGGRAALDKARTAGARLQRSLAEALALCGGLAVEDASAALDSATAARKLITDAVDLVSTLENQQADLSATLEASSEIAATLATQREAASDALLEATRAHHDASTALTDLTERRLAGHAAELASELTPGEPCAVGCGGTSSSRPGQTSWRSTGRRWGRRT